MSDATVSLLVNGERHDGPRGTLLDLLADLGTRPELVAIEHNGQIIPRAQFGDTPINDKDRVEIVQFVQGG